MKSTQKIIWICLAAVLIISSASAQQGAPSGGTTGTGTSSGSNGQPTPTPSPTPTPNPAVAALQEQNALLEEKIKLLKQQQELAKFYTPSLPKGMEGSINLKGDQPIETVAAAYKALDQVATKIASNVNCQTGEKLMIYSESQLNSLLALQAFEQQLKLLSERVKQAADVALPTEPTEFAPSSPGLVTGIALVGPAIQAVVDLISLFRTDVEITNKDIVLAENALVAAVVGKMRVARSSSDAKCILYYPAAYPPNLLLSASEISDKLTAIGADYSRIVTKLLLLQDAKAKANSEGEKQAKAAADAKGKAEKLKAEIGEIEKKIKAETNPAKKKKLEEEKDKKQGELNKTESDAEKAQNLKQLWKDYENKVDFLAKDLQAAKAAMDTFREALLKQEGDSAQTLLTRLLRAEKLRTAIGQANSTLQLQVQKASGSVVTRKGLFRGTRVSYSGGAIASYLLYNQDGSVLKSGTFPEYPGFERADLK
jgi:hypothetical protein